MRQRRMHKERQGGVWTVFTVCAALPLICCAKESLADAPPLWPDEAAVQRISKSSTIGRTFRRARSLTQKNAQKADSASSIQGIHFCIQIKSFPLSLPDTSWQSLLRSKTLSIGFFHFAPLSTKDTRQPRPPSCGLRVFKIIHQNQKHLSCSTHSNAYTALYRAAPSTASITSPSTVTPARGLEAVTGAAASCSAGTASRTGA